MKIIFEKINQPYKKLKSENLLIRKYYSESSDWNKEKFASIKENIKDHLRKEQSNQCCYCRSMLGFDIRQTEIEHIIPKSKEKNFAFISKNLALCCPGCNSSKSIKDVLIIKNRAFFNLKSTDYKIVHPYFDKYSEHIQIEGSVIYTSKTPKGLETIRMCELSRLTLAEENAKKFYSGQSKIKSIIFHLINTLERNL